MTATAGRGVIPTLPLVGRGEELAVLTHALDAVQRGQGSTLVLAGDAGVGKTRLALATADEARRRGWTVAWGRAYPVETGVPYALFADAFVPVLQAIEPAALAVLSRGGEADLAQLFPAAAGRAGAAAPRGDPVEARGRLLWNFAQFLGRLAARTPVLVVLENLHWADPSSVELLHFAARHLGDRRVLVLGTYNASRRADGSPLADAERSLVSLGAARVVPVGPLPRRALDELLQRAFGVDPEVVGGFADRLYERTRGNAFFVEEMLKALVASGRLREAGGRWTGWDASDIALPSSVREALVARLARLGADARAVGDVAAVLGTRMRYEAIAAVSGLPTAALVDALDALRREHVLEERLEDGIVIYDFTHPLLQETLYAELGHARARLLHARIADALEALHGAEADAHADELAFHFARGEADASAAKAARYLAAAGRAALARYATPEAVRYLEGALALRDRVRAAAAEPDDRLVADLARARQRAGDFAGALALWQRDRDAARAAGDDARLARVERRLGLTSYWTGNLEAAFAHYEAALAAAARAGDDVTAARVHRARGIALQERGQAPEALGEHETALAIAERVGDDALRAAVHRALMMDHLFTCDAAQARACGERTIALAAASGAQWVEWSAHWAMAVLSGLTGHAEDLRRHVGEARRLAHAMHSPALDAWTAEVEIEYASGIGDWEAGLALAERTLPVARALGLRGLLPRLLVWTGLIHLGRGSLEQAKALFDEAWRESRAGRIGAAPVPPHSAIPAHTGLAAYHATLRDWPEAIRLGEAGIALARSSGYGAWAIHRLLPIVIEAAIWSKDFERAARYARELRSESARMGHRLGLAWSAAADALMSRFAGREPQAMARILAAVDELEAIPFVMDAARLRRRVAQLLAEDGDREQAVQQFRRAHDIYVRLGAEGELRAVRDELRALGARPPARIQLEGEGALTGREREIALLVARRKSNKEIGAALGISSRTVSTHLSNIFAKLGVTSRGELTDRVREMEGAR